MSPQESCPPLPRTFDEAVDRFGVGPAVQLYSEIARADAESIPETRIPGLAENSMPTPEMSSAPELPEPPRVLPARWAKNTILY